jgi:hypothetical protein
MQLISDKSLPLPCAYSQTKTSQLLESLLLSQISIQLFQGQKPLSFFLDSFKYGFIAVGETVAAHRTIAKYFMTLGTARVRNTPNDNMAEAKVTHSDILNTRRMISVS